MNISEALEELLLDDGAVDDRVYPTGKVPAGETFPYITFLDTIGDTESLMGDAADLTRLRSFQVSLWMRLSEYDLTLVKRVKDAMHRVPLATTRKTFRCRVYDFQKLDEDERDITQIAFTLHIDYATASL